MLDQKTEKPEPQRFQPSLLDVVAKLIFYSHLILSAVYASIIIAIHPYIISSTITFICVVVYGYMIVWVAIINLILLCINRVSWSIWLVRIGIKLIISLFPLLAVLSYLRESWLFLRPLTWFMGYLFIFSILYVVYELSAYFCCERTNPDWIYRVSRGELADIRKGIVGRRKQFLLNNS